MNTDFTTNGKILLTGAGFTHNFGTPLSKEMWATIFNHEAVQSSPRIRQLMLNDFDYESIYYTIMEGTYTDSEKEAINTATICAYIYLDSVIRDYRFTSNSPYPVNIYKVQNLINLFSGTRARKGFFFTLNQDLFVERKYYNGERPFLLGIQNKSEWFSSIFNQDLKRTDYYNLPSEEELEKHKLEHLSIGKFFYIKLHGSCNWKSPIRPYQMVIGRGKEKQIQEEPLLSWYFNIFKNVFSQPNNRLLIIGYGFNDEHINQVIANSVKNHDLKIHIISPVPPWQFQNDLIKTPYGKDILTGLIGYHPYKLVQMFPGDQSDTQAWLSLKEQFLQ